MMSLITNESTVLNAPVEMERGSFVRQCLMKNIARFVQISIHYDYQHLLHLSTMCTTGGFFLPKCQGVPQ